MSRGLSSRQKNLLSKMGQATDGAPLETEAVGQPTDQTRADAQPVQPAFASSTDKAKLKFLEQTVDSLDAAGRLTMLEWALSETPLSKSETSAEKRQSRKRRRDESKPSIARSTPSRARPSDDRNHPSPTDSDAQEASDGAHHRIARKASNYPVFVAPVSRSAREPKSKSALIAHTALVPALQRARSTLTKVPDKAALPARLSPTTRLRSALRQKIGHSKAAAWQPAPVLDLSVEVDSQPQIYAKPHPARPDPAPNPGTPNPANPDEKVDEPSSEPQDIRTGPKIGLIRRLLTSSFASRLIKTIAGVAIMIVVGLAPLQRLFQSSSVEAIINAHTITLRAPIDGQIRAETTTAVIGKMLGVGETIFTIENRRADRSRLDDLQRSLAAFEEERPLVANRLENRRALHKDLAQQTRLFLAGRIAQLEARAAEIRADIVSTAAQRDEAKAAFARTTELAKNRTESIAALMRAERDAIVAQEATEAAQHRLEGVQVELEAARQGTFIGDSYNDRPHSAQRLEELVQEIAELETSLRAHDNRIERLRGEVADETFRQSLASNALVSAPGRGRIWEVLTSEGEEVHKGQDLVRLLDCSNSVVTAVVSETVYNRLRIGAPARFRFRDDRKEWSGEVIGLTGVAASAANLAIQPSALMKESYHVAVNVPALANVERCDVGRTGRVVFDDATNADKSVTATTR
jgi:multidrug resistance efflux pump